MAAMSDATVGVATTVNTANRHVQAPHTWPVDTAAWVEASSAHASASSDERSKALRVLTFNVWFGTLGIVERFDALIALALARDADVICLQEVTPPFSQALRASQLLSATYAISDNDVGRYGCLILAKHELGPRFSEIEMATMMGRSLLVAELVPPGGGGSARAWCAGAVATVHLESLNSAKVRDAQLQTANRALARYPNAVLCGDFNFDDTQEYGDWHRAKVGFGQGSGQGGPEAATEYRRDPSKVENSVLARRTPNFVDTWAALRPSEPGKTFDGQSNPVCVHDRDERMRYDRIMLKSRTVVPTGGGGGGLAAWWRQVRGVDEGPSAAWTAASIDMVGTEPINDWNLKMSDHYGLVLEVRPAGGGC